MNDLEVKWGSVVDTDTLKRLKVIKVDNLYEQEKYEILMELMEKCNLEQLQEMIDIYLSEGKYEGKLLETTYRKLSNRFRIKG